jgi:hypothetical protein
MRRPPPPAPAPPPAVEPAKPAPKDELVLVAPETPTKVLFHIESVPAGATVTLEGKVLGVTPLDVERPAGQDGRTMLEVTLSKDGFLPMTATAGGSGGRVDLLQKLQAAPQESPPAPAPKEPPLPKDAAAPKPKEPPVVKEAPALKPKAPVHQAVKPVEKKPKRVGPRPASKLDEDDEPAPVDELKRPSH